MDPRLTSSAIWDAQSTYTQAGPRPGVPEPQNDTELVLQATGDQSASKQLRVKALKAGHPQRVDGGGLIWQYDGDTNWRGRDVPTVITGWEAVEWDDGSTVGTVQRTFTPHAITLSDGVVLCAAEVTHDSTPPNRVFVYKRTTAGVWSSASVFTQVPAWTFGAHPCLVLLPSGRVLCFHWIEDTIAEESQVRMHYSDDDGDSWSVGSNFALATAIDTAGSSGSGATGHDPGRLRAAYKDGQVVLVFVARSNDSSGTAVRPAERLMIWASDDLGATFSKVDESDNNTDGEQTSVVDLIAAGGRFHVLGTFSSTTSETLSVYSWTSAFDSPFNSSLVTITTGTAIGAENFGKGFVGAWSQASVALTADEDGVLYAGGTVNNGSLSYEGTAVIFRSLDNADTWGTMGQSLAFSDAATWWHGQDTATFPRHYSWTWQGGRLLCLHNWDADPGNEDDSLGCIYLGGYSTLTMPGYVTFPSDLARVSWSLTWLPFDLPGDFTNITQTSSGTNTEALGSPGELQLTTTTGTVYYTYTPSGSVAEGLIIRAKLKILSGGSKTADDVYIRLATDKISNDYDVRIRFTTTGAATQYRVYDANATAAVGADQSLATTDYIEVVAALSSGELAIWHRVSSVDGDRQWTAGPSTDSLTDGGGSGDMAIMWGHRNSATAASDWMEFHATHDEWTGKHLAGGQTNPDDLFPRPFSPFPVWIDDGVKVAALDGPAFHEDDWNIDTRYDFPVERVLPAVSSSPRERWRSTATGASTIGFQFPISGVVANPGTDSIGLYLGGINWRTGTLERWNGSSWASLASIDAAANRSTLPYTRQGSTITVNTGGTNTGQHWIRPGALVGHTVDLGGGKLRRVIHNTEGVWTTAGTEVRPVLWLDGMDGTEASSGNCDLWSTSLVLIHHGAGWTAGGYRLSIDSQSTVDGYHEVGVMVLGPLLVWGHDPSWGRVRTITPNVNIRTARDGTRRSRRDGPMRRAVEVAWVDGVDMTGASGSGGILGNQPSPDYVLGTSTGSPAPLAARYGTPEALLGLASYLDGPHTPVVYLPRIPKGTPDDITFIQPADMVYGRMLGEVRLETRQGDESIDEVVNVASIVIEEEL